MGVHIQTLLPALNLEGMKAQENKITTQSSKGLLLWQREKKKKLRRKRSGAMKGLKKPKILMKRRGPVEGSRRPQSEAESKVRTLQRLVPNGTSMGLDGLLRETAEYIHCLQMQVKVMQIMVQVFSGFSGKGGN